MIYKIESKQNDKIKEVLKLRKSSYQKETGLFIIEGFHMIEMANEEKLLQSVFSLEPIDYLDKNIPQYIVSKDILDKISNYQNSQGALAIVRMKDNKEATSNKALYLDDVNDPGNVGTLLRTALAFGFKDVILSPNSCSIYNDKVIQASQGAIFKLNFSYMDAHALEILKNKGYKIISTSLQASVPLEDIKRNEKVILVLGNEAHGVKEEVLNISDYRVRINIKDIESLNVAIAGGIAMYYLANLEK